MNIQAQFCGILIIGLIMFFFFTNKKIGLFTEKVFVRVLIGSLLCLSLDILSIVVINQGDSVPTFCTEIACKAYLVSLLWMAFGSFDYMLTDLMSETQYYKQIIYFVVITIIESIAILFTPVQWYCKGSVVYSYGTSALLTYAFASLYFLTIITLLIIKYKRINPSRRLAMILWLGLGIGAAAIQFAYKELLLVGFALALSMAILFFILENPESMQDRRYGCFNSHALMLFLNRVYEQKASYGVLDFYFIDSNGYVNKLSIDNDAFEQVLTFLEKYPKLKVFKNIDNEIVVFSQDSNLINKILEDFKAYVSKLYKGEFPSIDVVVIEDTIKLDSSDVFLELIARTRAKLPVIRGLQVKNIDSEDIKELHEYTEVKKELNSALLEDRIEVFYQPIYSLCEGKYISCEALARIRKKDGSLLSPGLFIPVAESTGLIVQVGEKVFSKVCKFLSNKDIAEKLKYVEINLSVAQLEEIDLADKFIEIMKKNEICPQQINLEITESTAIKGKINLINNMNKFLDQGLTFSLDDFGKGESNLMYLVEMPVSIVKLDMDMTKAYFTEPKAKYVIDATVRMAHELGLEVVSEGVESEQELIAMFEEKIDFIQGYYFSKPLPEAEFIEELKNIKKAQYKY